MSYHTHSDEVQRQQIENALIDDYANYLAEKTLEELKQVSRTGVFTTREAEKVLIEK